MKKYFYVLPIIALLLMSSSLYAQTLFITQNPTSTAGCPGSTVVFTVAANDTTAIDSFAKRTTHYKWMVMPAGTSSWDTINSDTGAYIGSATNMLQVTVATSMNNYLYRAIVYFIDTTVSGINTIYSAPSSTAVLSVLPVPDTAVLSGATTMCNHGSTLLSSSLSTGVWGSADVHIATVLSSGWVHAVNAGTAVINYSVTNSCGTAVTSHTITIDTLPNSGSVFGNMAVCLSGTVAFTDTALLHDTAHLYTGLWSSSNTVIATINVNGIITAGTAGIDTIIYTVSDAHCTSVAWQVFYVDTFMSPLPIAGSSNACVGSTIALTNPNDREMPIWSVLNSTASISTIGLLTGLSSGIDTVMYMDSNACNSVTAPFFYVTIDTPLNAGVISGITNQVCSGSVITLYDATGGGIWVSSNTSIALVDGFGNVTGRTQGSVLISYSLFNSCGVSAATYSVTVSVPALAITGSDSVGVGNIITVYDAAVGGIWSSVDTILTINSVTGLITGDNAGTATITYSINNACGVSTSYYTVYVGNAPVVAAISPLDTAVFDTVCFNNYKDLSNATPGGVWSTTSPGISVNSSGQVRGLIGLSKDTVSYTVTNAFGSTTVIKPMFVNEPPVYAITLDSVVSVRDTFNLFSYISHIGGGRAGNGYWIVSSPIPDTVAVILNYNNLNALLTIIKAGSFTLEYITADRCGIDTVKVNMRNPVKVIDINRSYSDMNIYPNPSDGSFIINISSADDKDAIVTVTNMIGQKVEEYTLTTNSVNRVVLNQPAGMYLISAITAHGEKYFSKVSISK